MVTKYHEYLVKSWMQYNMYEVLIHVAISCSVEYSVLDLSYLVYALCSQILKKYVARELMILKSKTCHPSAIRVIYDIMIHTYNFFVKLLHCIGDAHRLELIL